MTKKHLSFTLIAALLFILNIQAEGKVYDIISLKDGKSIIKGLITEQVLGESIKITPYNAILKFDFQEIANIATLEKKDSNNNTIRVDRIQLKNHHEFEGDILETAPQKWVVIKTSKIPTQTYKLDDIAKTGKGVVNPKESIFEAYGLLDVLTIQNKDTVKGIITEQVFGETVKIQTQNKGVLIFDLVDVTNAQKEAFDSSKDIFKQSTFIDVLELHNGTRIRGIIIQQTPGKEIRIVTPDNSLFVQKYSDVSKLLKEENIAKELPVKELAVEEPELIGDCFLVLSPNKHILLEKQAYKQNNQKKPVYQIDGKTSPIQIPIGKEVKIIVRVADNNLSPLQQVYIIQTEANIFNKQRKIDTSKYPFIVDKPFEQRAATTPYKCERFGSNSFEISFKPNVTGEFAIYVHGSGKIFSLFGVEKHHPKK